jgi:hypothetical protein
MKRMPCNLRYAVKTSGIDHTPSKRTIFLCMKRYGFMLKHWKCVGIENKDCPRFAARHGGGKKEK